MAFNILPLSPEGEGHTQFNLAEVQIELVVRYNYVARLWCMDILDASGASLVNGLMLVPNVDLIKPHTSLKATIGALVVVEKNMDDHKNPDLLGTDVQLIWYPPGEAVVLP